MLSIWIICPQITTVHENYNHYHQQAYFVDCKGERFSSHAIICIS